MITPFASDDALSPHDQSRGGGDVHYPGLARLSGDFDEAALRRTIARSNDDLIPQPLSLHLHTPACGSACSCQRDASPGGGPATHSNAYLLRLYREIALKAALFDRDRDVLRIYMGSGTPAFLDPAQAVELLDVIRHHFSLAGPRRLECAIGLDPHTLDPQAIEPLADAGFNHARLLLRRSPAASALPALVQHCHDSGFGTVTVELPANAPARSGDASLPMLERVLQARPDHVLLHAPRLPLRGAPPAAPSPGERRLLDAGYVHLGLEHFVLPGSALLLAQAAAGLQHDAIGYTTHTETDLVGLGAGALSRIGASISLNAGRLGEWEDAIDHGRLPVERGVLLDEDDRIRADALDALVCEGRLDLARLSHRFALDAAQRLQDALQRLQAPRYAGLVEFDGQVIRATSHGRRWLRIIAQCFERTPSRAADLSPAGPCRPR